LIELSGSRFNLLADLPDAIPKSYCIRGGGASSPVAPPRRSSRNRKKRDHGAIIDTSKHLGDALKAEVKHARAIEQRCANEARLVRELCRREADDERIRARRENLAGTCPFAPLDGKASALRLGACNINGWRQGQTGASGSKLRRFFDMLRRLDINCCAISEHHLRNHDRNFFSALCSRAGLKWITDGQPLRHESRSRAGAGFLVHNSLRTERPNKLLGTPIRGVAQCVT
jgi:hypothetical protein